MKSDKLTGIEAGRGVAAMLVVGVHARDHLFKNFGVPVPLGDLFFFGHAGVDFFFVLSGFIIMHVHASDIGRPGRLGHYLQRRFTRIYPFYWIVLLLTVLALALSSRPDAFPSIPYITSSALLLPGGGAPVVPVAWTLKNEVVFYAVFSVLILHRNLGLVLLGVWLAIILSRFSDLLVGGNPLFDPFNVEFFFGMGAAWLLRRRRIPAPLVVLFAGAAVFFMAGGIEDAGLLPGQSVLTHTGYAIGALFIILGLVESERQHRLYVPKIMTSLGGASYSIYLTHLLGIGAIWQIMLRTGLDRTLPLWGQFIVIFVGGVATGWIMSQAVERPILSLARRLIGRKEVQPHLVHAAHGRG